MLAPLLSEVCGLTPAASLDDAELPPALAPDELCPSAEAEGGLAGSVGVAGASTDGGGDGSGVAAAEGGEAGCVVASAVGGGGGASAGLAAPVVVLSRRSQPANSALRTAAVRINLDALAVFIYVPFIEVDVLGC